jgi:putative transcriptional regulator
VSDVEFSSSLLVAMPQLLDPNFRRCVIQLIEHDAAGTFGLVLNREVELTASDLCESLELQWNGDPQDAIRWGGPVQVNTGWVLFADQVDFQLGVNPVQSVLPGLSFAGSLAVLEAVALAPPQEVRLFLGYAGWGPGQLEGEIASGAWLLAPSSPETVFGVEPEAMWEHVVRGLGVDPATLVSTSGVH